MGSFLEPCGYSFQCTARREWQLCATQFGPVSGRSWPGTAADGRIAESLVRDEIGRLRAAGSPVVDDVLVGLLTPLQAEALDLFDRLQLRAVVGIFRRSNSLADAGRELFAATRSKRSSANDSDRLRKYLARFDLECARIVQRSI